MAFPDIGLLGASAAEAKPDAATKEAAKRTVRNDFMDFLSNRGFLLRVTEPGGTRFPR
jgi:hypothetical protein